MCCTNEATTATRNFFWLCRLLFEETFYKPAMTSLPPDTWGFVAHSRGSMQSTTGQTCFGQRQYVRTCRDFQLRKKPPVRPAGLLCPLDPPDAPFRQVGMDLLGPFPSSVSVNKLIIVATDYLTRYAETKALPNGTASEVAIFFMESIVLRHGVPTIVITDRGTAFTAPFLQDIFRLTNSPRRKCTSYHPQTNGLRERLTEH